MIVSPHFPSKALIINQAVLFSIRQRKTNIATASVTLFFSLSLSLCVEDSLFRCGVGLASLVVVGVLSDGYALPLFPHLAHHRNHHHQLLPPQVLDPLFNYSTPLLTFFHGTLRSNLVGVTNASSHGGWKALFRHHYLSSQPNRSSSFFPTSRFSLPLFFHCSFSWSVITNYPLSLIFTSDHSLTNRRCVWLFAIWFRFEIHDEFRRRRREGV